MSPSQLTFICTSGTQAACSDLPENSSQRWTLASQNEFSFMQVLPIDHFHTLAPLTDRKARKCVFANSEALTRHLGDSAECYITVAFQEQHLLLFCDFRPLRIVVCILKFVSDVGRPKSMTICGLHFIHLRHCVSKHLCVKVFCFNYIYLCARFAPKITDF